VFPGGRVDDGDSIASGFPEPLHPAVTADLQTASRRPGAAYARTAIRETFEETGLLVGIEAAGSGGTAPVWQAFADRGRAPSFGALDFICRAITLTYSKGATTRDSSWPTAWPRRWPAAAVLFWLANPDELRPRVGGRHQFVSRKCRGAGGQVGRAGAEPPVLLQGRDRPLPHRRRPLGRSGRRVLISNG
jgi:8-oxo-dGTP pyrophosphatase MutT (NUDIX family)